MALAVSNEAQLVLFKGLFGPNDPVTIAVADLIAKGAKVEVSLYIVKIVHGGQIYQQALTVGTTALLKGSVSEVAKAQNKFMLKSWIESIVGVGLGPVSAPGGQPMQFMPEPSITGTQPTLSEMLKAKMAEPAPVVQAAPKTVIPHATTGKVVKLVEALDLGQQVRGTSVGSVYRVVALNDRVKVATSIKGTAISMRVECKAPTAEELLSVKEVFDWKGDYGSKHLEAGSIPTSRVIGALLFSLGVKFDKVVQGKNDVEAANG